ncbi:MAG: hypothetical protein HQK67_05525, partial [Desulfamplus sp.]|nr:hypothetical protein [Desulfamplus sp.]
MLRKFICSISARVLILVFIVAFFVPALPQQGLFAQGSSEVKSNDSSEANNNQSQSVVTQDAQSKIIRDKIIPDKTIPENTITDKTILDNTIPDKTILNKIIPDNRISSLQMLISLIELRKNLKDRIAEKKNRLETTTSDNEKDNIKQELSRLDKELDGAIYDFQSIATGVDMGLFEQKKGDEFKWQNEILSLLEPIIKELKQLTLKARQKTKLREDIDRYANLLPVADLAIQNINVLIAGTSDIELQNYLKKLVPEWMGAKEQIANKLKITRMQLVQMDKEDDSLLKSSKASIFMALLACFAMISLLRIIYLALVKFIPNYRSEYRPFYVRVINIFFKISAVILTGFVLIFVFYSSEDWLLMSLSIIFVVGLAWTLKQSIPRLWQQSRLVLNIGSVREGERIVYHGVPWIVKSLNVFCKFENPSLDITIRLPIEELVGQISRPIKTGEPWFPCRKNDWVILSDGTWGKVASLSHEMVEVIRRGGARKIYQTPDFLSLCPLNLSTNFRIEVMFGIDYSHQKNVTSTIPETIRSHIMEHIEKEGYANHL